MISAFTRTIAGLWLEIDYLATLFVAAALISVSCAPSAQPADAATTTKDKVRQNHTWFPGGQETSGGSTVLVFIHGIFGNSKETWTSESGVFWPDLILSDPLFVDASKTKPRIFLSGYQTSLDSAQYDTDQAVLEVLNGLETNKVLAEDTKKIVFVCHSTGGIVARRLLARHWKKFSKMRVGLALLASPSDGSRWATTLSALEDFYKNKLAQQLQGGNPFLRDLDAEFSSMLKTAREEDREIRGLELVEHHFLLHSKFLPGLAPLVEGESGSRYFGPTIVVPDSNHFSIVKPDRSTDRSHEELRNFFAEGFDLTPKQRALYVSARSLAESYDVVKSSGLAAKVLAGFTSWPSELGGQFEDFHNRWSNAGLDDRQQVPQRVLYLALSAAARIKRGTEATDHSKRESIAWARQVFDYYAACGDAAYMREAALDWTAIYLDMINTDRSPAVVAQAYADARAVLIPFLDDEVSPASTSEAFRISSRLAYDRARPEDGNTSGVWDQSALQEAWSAIDKALAAEPNNIRNHTQRVRIFRQLHNGTDGLLNMNARADAALYLDDLSTLARTVKTSAELVPPLHAVLALEFDLLRREALGVSDQRPSSQELLAKLDTWLGRYEALKQRIFAMPSLADEWAFDLGYDSIRALVLRYLLLPAAKREDTWSQVERHLAAIADVARRLDMLRVHGELARDAMMQKLAAKQRQAIAHALWGFAMDSHGPQVPRKRVAQSTVR